MAGRRKKNRTHLKGKKRGGNENPDDPTAPKIPKSFVIRSGKVTRTASALVMNLRRVMEPNTAIKLRERKTNRLKDFVNMAGPLGVSHFMILSQTERGTNLRICKSPRGPTMMFRVEEYSLMRDIAASQKRPRSPGTEYSQPPLLVLNNFNGAENHIKLMATMFQNMFPSLDVQRMKLSECRRVLLISYEAETQQILVRHYFINIKIAGVSKSVKHIQLASSIPDLHKFDDISEFFLREAFASESDVEEAGENVVELSNQSLGRRKAKTALAARAIRLTELGPRLNLSLVKIEDGFCEGEVIYHRHLQLTAEERDAKKAEWQRREQERQTRRAEQEANVERKEREKEEHRLKCGGGGVKFASDTKQAEDDKSEKEENDNYAEENEDEDDLNIDGDCSVASDNENDDESNDDDQEDQNDDGDDQEDQDERVRNRNYQRPTEKRRKLSLSAKNGKR